MKNLIWNSFLPIILANSERDLRISPRILDVNLGGNLNGAIGIGPVQLTGGISNAIGLATGNSGSSVANAGSANAGLNLYGHNVLGVNQNFANVETQGQAEGMAGVDSQGNAFADAVAGPGGMAGSNGGIAGSNQQNSGDWNSNQQQSDILALKDVNQKCNRHQECGTVKRHNHSAPLVCRQGVCRPRVCHNHQGCQESINFPGYCNPKTKRCELCPVSCFRRYQEMWRVQVCCGQCPESCPM